MFIDHLDSLFCEMSKSFAHFSVGLSAFFLWICRDCLFYTSLVRNTCVLVKTNKIGAGLKLVEGVIVEKEREKFRLLYYFHIFQKAKLWFPCPDYMIPITQRESYNPE